MRHLLESSCPGSPTKRLQDPEKTQVSGIYASWMQSDFLRDVTGQKVQGCSHGRFHSLDLHPWPHQTNPHLTKVKINQACCSQGQIIRAGTKCVYLLDFLLGGHVLMLMRAGLLLKRLQMQVQLKKSAELYETMGTHSFCQEGPNLDLWRWGLQHFSGVHPRSHLGAPTEEGGYWRLPVRSRVDLLSAWCCCLLCQREMS